MFSRFIILTTNTSWISSVKKTMISLCSLRWLNPNLNRLKSFKPVGSWTSNILLQLGIINFNNVFLNMFKFLEQQIFMSNKFYSVIAQGKESRIKCRVLGTWHDSSTVRFSFQQCRRDFLIDSFCLQMVYSSKSSWGFLTCKL